jgi:hypothetical protein
MNNPEETTEPQTQQEVLFALFDQGFKVGSPEVKNLIYKGKPVKYKSAAASYYRWEVARGIKSRPDSSQAGVPRVDIIAPSFAEKQLVPPPQEDKPAVDTTVVNDSEAKNNTTNTKETPSAEEEDLEESDGDNNGSEPETPLDKTTTIAAINTLPSDRGKAGKKGVPTNLRTQGIRVTVELNLKTLYAYNLVANMVEGDLQLGDYLDETSEDYLKGRGWDIGLVDIAGSLMPELVRTGGQDNDG